MTFLRALIAGSFFPAMILPIFMTILTYFAKGEILGALVVHYLPWIWGIWNILFFAFFRDHLNLSETGQYLLAGAVLGLLVALYGVFVLGVPVLLGFPASWFYAPLIVVPVIYALLWLYVVRPLNALVGL